MSDINFESGLHNAQLDKGHQKYRKKEADLNNNIEEVKQPEIKGDDNKIDDKKAKQLTKSLHQEKKLPDDISSKFDIIDKKDNKANDNELKLADF